MKDPIRHPRLFGAVSFGLVSLAVFATVAYAEGWMYRTLGLPGAYLVWTLLFVVFGSAALIPLLPPGEARRRFPLLFTIAFLVYAAGWVAAYFLLRGTLGEWLGSLVGSVLMALSFALGFQRLRATLMYAGCLFIANSLGYFLGSGLNNVMGRPLGMLLWGGAYGVFLGAGLGFVLDHGNRSD